MLLSVLLLPFLASIFAANPAAAAGDRATRGQTENQPRADRIRVKRQILGAP